MESRRLETRLGPLAWQSSGRGPTLVFFAGALANHELWRDVIAALNDRYRCVTVDLPLGGHPWPLREGADRSAASLARLLPDCLELLGVDDATVVVNDTAGGLLLLSLATGHPALARAGRLVLTNCESYEHFPPESLKKASALSRALPGLARGSMWLQLWLWSRLPAARSRGLSGVTAAELDAGRAQSLFGPALRDRRVAGDLVAAMVGFRPQLLLDAAREIPALRSAGPADLGRGVPLLPTGPRPAARLRLPPRHAGPRFRRQDMGPGRQSGRGGRRHRRIRARASAITTETVGSIL
jgi:pimeloyl-ACP methyl ester carboxylesterase